MVQNGSVALHDIRAQVVGLDVEVPLLDGSTRRPINFDNAASTPALRPVLDTVNNFMLWYSSVHRGTGFKSRVSTQAYEDVREVVGRYVGARTDQHIVSFGKMWDLRRQQRGIHRSATSGTQYTHRLHRQTQMSSSISPRR